MNKLSEFFKGSLSKFKNLSKVKKIALAVGIIGIILALTFFGISRKGGNEALLVNTANLTKDETKQIIDKLKEKKVTPHIVGKSIYVPKDQVDQISMEVFSEIQLSDESKGWSLFNNQSTFGLTQTEEQVKLLVAMEGRLEQNIKGYLPQIVDSVKVNITPSKESVFVTDKTPSNAAVVLNLKPGMALSKEAVRSIIMLVYGSVQNLPKENIHVLGNSKVLSDNIFDEEGSGAEDIDKRQQAKKEYEKNLENKVIEMLTPIYKDKFTVHINADLDFDAVKQQTTEYGPNGTVISEKQTSETSNNGQVTNNQTQTGTDSPLDSNATAAAANTNSVSNSGGTQKNSSDRNYQVPEKQTSLIKAPGTPKAITASVVIGINISDAQKNSINNAVATAIGYDQKRGDRISVEVIEYPTTPQIAQPSVDNAKKAQMSKLYTYAAAGAGALLLIVTLLTILLRKKKKNPQETFAALENINVGKGINVVVGDSKQVQPEQEEVIEEEPKKKINYKPIDIEGEENEFIRTEREIKKYALEKPEQVVDIIKAWLAEDER